MERLAGGGVELAVRNAPARAHQLNPARLELPPVAHAVLVLQRAFQHVAENLHVAMRMRPEALPRSNAVIVDDAQAAEAHLRRIVIIGERKSVIRFQPAVVGMAAFVGPSDVQFSRRRFHGNKMTAPRDSAQCHVVGVSLPFGYAGCHGTPTTALLRGGG